MRRVDVERGVCEDGGERRRVEKSVDDDGGGNGGAQPRLQRRCVLGVGGGAAEERREAEAREVRRQRLHQFDEPFGHSEIYDGLLPYKVTLISVS